MINVLINGINGRMGKEVVNQVNISTKFNLLCGIDKISNADYSVPIYNNTNSIKIKPDIIIDFSIPEATMNILEYAKTNSIPIVIATTGFSKEDLSKIAEYSTYIPIFKSRKYVLRNKYYG